MLFQLAINMRVWTRSAKARKKLQPNPEPTNFRRTQVL